MFPKNIHKLFEDPPRIHIHMVQIPSPSTPVNNERSTWHFHGGLTGSPEMVNNSQEVENSFDSKMSQAENPCVQHPISSFFYMLSRRSAAVSSHFCMICMALTIQKCCKNLETHGCSMENGRTRWKITEKPWGITEKPGSVSSAESDLHLGSWVVI